MILIVSYLVGKVKKKGYIITDNIRIGGLARLAAKIITKELAHYILMVLIGDV